MQKIVFALIAGVIAHDPTDVFDDYPKNPNIDVLHYAFDLTLRDGTDEIGGVATIDVRFLADGIERLRFDLIGVGNGSGMAVSSVTSMGTPLAFTHVNDVLWIELQRASRASDRISVSVLYSGTAATGLIIGPNKHGDRTFFSDNWPNKARNWLPTVDHPYDKATVEFSILAPNHYQVVSNGLLIEETDRADNQRLTHWKESVPIATWLYAVGVARFAVQHVDDYQGKPIQTWVYRQDRNAGFFDFAIPSKDVLEFYGDRVGPYAYEKLANVQANSVAGGMEAASTPFYGDVSVTGTRTVRWRNVVIHELAHQWFGNAVTEYDWDDVWLSEGFATYFTLLYIEHAYGRDEFVQGLRSSAERVWSFYRERPDYRIVHDNLTDMGQVTSSQTYQKGAWTLHMLRGIVGDDAFWRGIQTYYHEHKDANATTADFRRAMEEASGQTLGWFFDQWLYQGGALILDGGWRYDIERRQLVIQLNQVQDGGYQFRMPMDIAIHVAAEEAPRMERLTVSATDSVFTIDLDVMPERVVLDPNIWVLMEASFQPF